MHPKHASDRTSASCMLTSKRKRPVNMGRCCGELANEQMRFATKTYVSVPESGEIIPDTEAVQSAYKRFATFSDDPQVVWCFTAQNMVKSVDVFGDSDWAGEMSKGLQRRSTTCVVDHWQACDRNVSVTEQTITLCSAEALLFASNLAAAGTLQTRHFMEEAADALQARSTRHPPSGLWLTEAHRNNMVRRTRGFTRIPIFA